MFGTDTDDEEQAPTRIGTNRCKRAMIKSIKSKFDVCLSVHRSISVEKKTNSMLLNALLHLQSAQHISATYIAHHQELETILVLV